MSKTNKTAEFMKNPPIATRQQLWLDNNTGKYAIIQENLPMQEATELNKRIGSIKTKIVYKNGEDVRTRVNYCTGFNSFGERKLVADQLGGKSVDAKTPSFISHAKMSMYTPALTRLDGYVQHPRPVVKPYQNKIEYTSEIATKMYVPKQKETLKMVKKHPEASTSKSSFNSKPGTAQSGVRHTFSS